MAEIQYDKKFHEMIENKWGKIKVPIVGDPPTLGQLQHLKAFQKEYPQDFNELFYLVAVHIADLNVTLDTLTISLARWMLGKLNEEHKREKLGKKSKTPVHLPTRWKPKKVHKNKNDNKQGFIEELRSKKFIDYYEYIKSPEWQEKSKQAKIRAGNRCQVCNRSSQEVSLHTHHRTYERLGHESPNDLTVLCADCHNLFEMNSSHRPSKRKS